VKLREGPAGSFSEPRLDRRLRNFDDPGIASEAARERSQRERTESGKHLHELPVRHRFADEVSVHDDPTLEEAPIPRQQDSLLAAGDLGELVIPGVTAVYRIEPGEAQVARELAEVDVEHEADRIGKLSTHPRDSRDVDGLESRKDRDAIGVLHAVLEGDRFPVDQDQVDLGMRDTETSITSFTEAPPSTAYDRATCRRSGGTKSLSEP
jgi:hypothetical protein